LVENDGEKVNDCQFKGEAPARPSDKFFIQSAAGVPKEKTALP
jgi:hypothetical protein